MFSAIFASMNREKALERSLPSWTKINKIKDFVIVDWSSSKPLIENKIIQEQINEYGNIKIIRVENQKYFYRSLAWNLAFQNTDPENKILIKLDAEYYNKNDSWINRLTLDEDNTLKNCFYAGITSTNFDLYGFLIVNKKHFDEGYNENIDAIWGFEDADLYYRIQKKYNILYATIKADDIYYINKELKEYNLILSLEFSKLFLFISSMYSLLYIIRHNSKDGLFEIVFNEYCENHVFTYLYFMD